MMNTLILVLLSFSISFSQYLTLKVGTGSSFHFDNGIAYNENNFNDYQTQELPKMFEDGASHAITVLYNFVEDEKYDALGHFQLGLLYSYDKTRSKALAFDFLGWGDHFEMKTFAPFIGYSFYFPKTINGKYYLNLGYSYTDYKGLNKSKFNFFDTDYLSSKSLYVNVGLSLNVYRGFGFDYSLSYQNATIIPKNLYASVNNVVTQSKLAQGYLSDDYFTMRFALLYTL